MIKRRLTEDKANTRQAVRLSIIAIALLIIFLIYGLPLLARFSTFIVNLGQKDEQVQISDTTPPAPPTFLDVPEFTNKSSLKITGKSEDGATIVLYKNGDQEEVLADKSGSFQFNFDLLKGKNTLSAVAVDKAGNQSQATKEVTITNDTESPTITIESPQNGDSFSGNFERQLTIKGSTGEKTDLTINDRSTLVNADGSFTFSTSLEEGENTFNLKAVDKAGNETETSITVNYSS